ncbi:38520_t:CDS:2, partial [Gigaspora margarita]
EINNNKDDEPLKEITSHLEASDNIYISSIEYDISYDKQDISNFWHKESFNDDSDNSESDDPITAISTNLASNSSTNTQIIKTMQHIIYNFLFEYWNELKMVSLLSLLLDLYLKVLSNWNKETKKNAKTELRCQFEILITSNYEQTPTYSNSKN